MKPLLFLLLLFSACSHRDNYKKDLIVSGECEKEFKKSELNQGQEIWQRTSETSTAGMSYLVTGLGYSTDVIISFTSGLIGGLAVCSPLIALDIAADDPVSGLGFWTGECIGEAGVAVGSYLNPKLGPRGSHATRKWKCPNLDPVAKGLLRVSQCYQNNGRGDLALQQLKKMEESPAFKKCLSDDLKEEISKKASVAN